MVTTYRDQHHDVTDLEKGRAWCGSKPTMPLSESLRDTCDRVLPLFERGMAPHLRKGQTLLVVTHANACKALLRVLDPHVVIENVSFRRSRYPTRHTWCKPFSLLPAMIHPKQFQGGSCYYTLEQQTGTGTLVSAKRTMV